MKIFICWTITNAYMAACWKELAGRPGVEVFILGHEPETSDNFAYKPDFLQGLTYRLLASAERSNYPLILAEIQREDPDIIYMPGWAVPAYVRLAREPSLSGVPFIMGIDNPRKDTLRQRYARLKIGWLLDRMSCLFVIGERSWQFAKYLKIPENKIRRGTCGIDYNALSGLLQKRQSLAEGWPKAFLYIGRYVNVKGLPIMVEAYEKYRSEVNDPWPLRCCGMGPEGSYLRSREGIEDWGFKQPSEIDTVRLQSGVFIMPSIFDPWPLVIVESCASGLPVVCSEACGSGVECVRSYYNGLTVPTGEVEGLANAMVWMHNHYEQLPLMGQRSQQLAAPYGAEFWADRMLAAINDCCTIK